ncbi:MAG: alpha/beta fold hydrolase [Pseudomonadota bacterium]
MLPALEPDAEAPPLYWLVGGPGYGNDWPGAIFYKQLPFPFVDAAAALRTGRDIVLVDHRGAGASQALTCPELDPFGLGRFEGMFPLEQVRACRDRLSEAADLSQYHVAAAAADLELVRASLGHERISLLGFSYGTSLALAYLREHAEYVHSAVLQGVLPLDNKVPLEHAVNGERVLRLLFERCASDDACEAAFPGLADDFSRTLDALAEAPVELSIPVQEGVAQSVQLDRNAYASSIRMLMPFAMGQSGLPRVIHAAAKGDYGPFEEAVAQGLWTPGFSVGLYLSAQCPNTLRASAAEIAEAADETPFGNHRIAVQQAACLEWERADLPAGWFDPADYDAPMLLISGAMDHETPAAFAERVLERAAEAKHVVVPHMGHAPYDVSDASCFWNTIDAYLLEPESADTSCLSENESWPLDTRPGTP